MTHSVENDAPACRSCYAATLTPDQRERFHAEPVTSCVYYCPEHQRVQDDLMARIDWSKITTRPIPPGSSDQ